MTDVLQRVFTAVALIGNGLLAGVLFAVAISVIPAAFALPVDRYVQLHQLLGQNYDPTMRIIAGAAIVSDLLLATWLAPGAAATVLCGAATVSLGLVSAISQMKNVPINHRVRAVSATAVPDSWPDPRVEWRSWHRRRTALAIAALMANAVAASYPG